MESLSGTFCVLSWQTSIWNTLTQWDEMEKQLAKNSLGEAEPRLHQGSGQT